MVRNITVKDVKKYMGNNMFTTEVLHHALKDAFVKTDNNLSVFKNKFPSSASVHNVYIPVDNSEDWNQGFWVGILWLAYELSHDDKYKKTAEGLLPSFEKRISEKIGVNHHDMGFLYTPSCVAAYKLTGNTAAKETAVKAANHLISRYHENGGFIQAWGDIDDTSSGRLIIDCLLNIPLLFWTSEVTGNQTYAHIAQKHFDATIHNIIREDGSTYHTFYFDTKTGAPLKGVTAQGASDDSCWSRGQAWCMYGLMLTYKYVKKECVMPLFKSVANYFLNHLPNDYIPYWDLTFTSGNEERDSSAAAIAVCGLLEALKYMDASDPYQEVYRNAADKIMYSLYKNYSTRNTPGSNGLLLHAVYSKPARIGVDECNIWGDYFYMEALTRMTQNWDLYW